MLVPLSCSRSSMHLVSGGFYKISGRNGKRNGRFSDLLVWFCDEDTVYTKSACHPENGITHFYRINPVASCAKSRNYGNSKEAEGNDHHHKNHEQEHTFFGMFFQQATSNKPIAKAKKCHCGAGNSSIISRSFGSQKQYRQ